MATTWGLLAKGDEAEKVAKAWAAAFVRSGVKAEILSPAKRYWRQRYYLAVGTTSPDDLPPITRTVIAPLGSVLDHACHQWQICAGIVATSGEEIASLAAAGFTYPLVHFLPRTPKKFSAGRFLNCFTDVPSIINAAPYLGDAVAISMPETPRRRAVLAGWLPAGAMVFDGIRSSKGWRGCSMTYRALARGALAAGKDRLTVMEDDAVLPTDYPETMARIESYLDSLGDGWDMFAGVLSHVPDDATVSRRARANGITFVTLDRFGGMVFNIFNRRALEVMAAWDPGTRDRRHMINAVMSRAGLRVVTTSPFLFGHIEGESTQYRMLAGRYTELIRQSEDALKEK